MLLIKYTKLGNAKYIPHVDMLRQISRIMRRANIKVQFSQGFNPHELIYFAPPIPLPLASSAEYCCITTDEPADTFVQKFNEVSIDGIICLNAVKVDKNPNIAGKAYSATYKVLADSEKYEKIADAFSKDVFEITYLHKGEPITKDVRPMMLSYEVTDGALFATLSHGNLNLRADRFFEHFGIPISAVEKVDQGVQDGEIFSCEKYFS